MLIHIFFFPGHIQHIMRGSRHSVQLEMLNLVNQSRKGECPHSEAKGGTAAQHVHVRELTLCDCMQFAVLPSCMRVDQRSPELYYLTGTSCSRSESGREAEKDTGHSRQAETGKGKQTTGARKRNATRGEDKTNGTRRKQPAAQRDRFRKVRGDSLPRRALF